MSPPAPAGRSQVRRVLSGVGVGAMFGVVGLTPAMGALVHFKMFGAASELGAPPSVNVCAGIGAAANVGALIAMTGHDPVVVLCLLGTSSLMGAIGGYVFESSRP